MRSELTMAERIQICRHHEGGRITNKALSLWASKKMGKPISEMTISRILIRKIELLGSDVGSNRKHYRKPECPNLESIFVLLVLDDARGQCHHFRCNVDRESQDAIEFSST
ncbi:hypothetical protein R1flu_005963 [Riccia fluitans]|uniref:Transposase n=1 Tax=Riccia fluitans TaxID=41844 RepID=A0ABD1YVL3_9MARC